MADLTQQLQQIIDNTTQLISRYEEWDQSVQEKITELNNALNDWTTQIQQLMSQFSANAIMTREAFEAKAEITRRLCAGSGFVEWSMSWLWGSSNKYEINYGLATCPQTGLNFADLGFYLAMAQCIVNVNGYLLRLLNINIYDYQNNIKFPDPPSSPDQPYRQDLVFLEVWHEDVLEKDVVFPYGNVQYGATTYTAPDGTSFTTTSITDLGINQGYSAFGYIA